MKKEKRLTDRQRLRILTKNINDQLQVLKVFIKLNDIAACKKEITNVRDKVTKLETELVKQSAKWKQLNLDI